MVVGQAYIYQITVSTISQTTGYAVTGSLPPGLSFSSSGALQGYPTTPGHYVIPFSVTNAQGTASFTLTLDVLGVPVPVITSAVKIESPAATPLSFQITAANSPTSYAASGLPAGLTVNSSSGLITGTPSAAGIFTATLSATNSYGQGTRILTFYIGISPLSVTSFTPATAASGSLIRVTGLGFTDVAHVYFVSRANQAVTDLGVTVLSDQSMDVVLPPLNMVWYDRTPLVVASATHTAVTVPASATRMVSSGSFGSASSYLIVGTGATVTLSGGGGNMVYVESGGTVISGGGGGHKFFLESGATASITSGGGHVIFKSPNSTVINPGANYIVNVPQISRSSLASNTLLNVYDLPVISSGNASGTVGQTFSYTTTIDPYRPGITYSALGLPPGLNISALSGVISGTPTTEGVYSVTLRATDSNGTGSKSVQFTINPALLPVMSSAYRLDGATGTPLNFQLAATNSPSSYGVSGLPPGLSANTAGLISGTAVQGGVWIATVTISNANGSTSSKLTVAINRPQPVITAMPAAAAVGASLSLGGTGLLQTTAVYFKDRDLGIGKSGTIGTVNGIQANVTTPALNLSGTPGSLVTLIAEGGATVAVPNTMTVVPAGGSLNGSGGGHYHVLPGGTLTGSGSGSFTVYVESNGVVSPSGGGGHLIFAENGSTVDLRNSGGGNTVVCAPNAKVLYNGNATLVSVADLHASPVAGYLELRPIPIITSTSSARGYVNIPFYFVVTAQNSPTGFSATGVPAGLTLNTSSGAIGGAPTQPGTYMVGLTATNAEGSYTQNLTLVVGDPFDHWKDTQFASMNGGSENALASGTADADKDGISNLMEYAAGLNPLAQESSSDISGTEVSDGHLQISFRRIKGSGTGSAVEGYTVGGVQYVVEWSNNLGQWQSGAQHMEQVGDAVDNGDGTETVLVRMKTSMDALSKAFIRVRVERVP